MHSLSCAVKNCLLRGPAAADTGELEAAFLFPADFIGFKGHFAGNPLLPGIAEIMAAAHAVALAVKAGQPRSGAEKLLLNEIKNCKFVRPVRPDEELLVRFSLSGPPDFLDAQIKLRVNGETCAVMKLFFVSDQNWPTK